MKRRYHHQWFAKVLCELQQQQQQQTAGAAAAAATATTTTTTTAYYSSSCRCHWLLRCAPRNPPTTRHFLAKDSRNFRESIGECEGLFCGSLPKPSSDRPSKMSATTVDSSSSSSSTSSADSSNGGDWEFSPICLVTPQPRLQSQNGAWWKCLGCYVEPLNPRRFLEDILPAKVKHGVRERFANVNFFAKNGLLARRDFDQPPYPFCKNETSRLVTFLPSHERGGQKIPFWFPCAFL